LFDQLEAIPKKEGSDKPLNIEITEVLVVKNPFRDIIGGLLMKEWEAMDKERR